MSSNDVSNDTTAAEESAEDMGRRRKDQYRLRVTAGPDRDIKTHQVVPVNSPDKTTIIETDVVSVAVSVRIQKYKGFPKASPATCAYFDHPLHKSDQYSIAFSFIPKQDINGDDLLWGNDFDRPIRDRLPPGFDYAFKLAKWWVDPGLEQDARADKPWIFGPALSSWNVLRVGEKVAGDARKDDKAAWKLPNADSFGDEVVLEGGEGSGEELRSSQGVPADSSARKKFFLTPENRSSFTFEKGRVYQTDFGNPHLDFNDFTLNLPGGFHLNAIKYVDNKTHELRHTLKLKSTGEVVAVVLFSLLFGEELKEAEEEERKHEAPGTEHKDVTALSEKDANIEAEGEEASADDID